MIRCLHRGALLEALGHGLRHVLRNYLLQLLHLLVLKAFLHASVDKAEAGGRLVVVGRRDTVGGRR